jgi:hypothetical protein
VRRVLTSPGRLLARWWRGTPVLLVALIAIVLGLGAGAAWGYFTASATGSGVVSVGTAKTVTVTVTGEAVLYPGLTTGLKVTVTNPNTYTLTVVSIAEAGGKTAIIVTGAPGCTGTNAGVSVLSKSFSGVTIPVGTNTITLTTSVAMATTSASACQGATFHVPITMKVEKT